MPVVARWSTAQDDVQAVLGALSSSAIDTTPPTVTAPIQTIANGKVGATVPMNVRWSATDVDGPVSYKLWRSTNGGAYVRENTLWPTVTSRTYRLPAGNSYRFLVRAARRSLRPSSTIAHAVVTPLLELARPGPVRRRARCTWVPTRSF